MQWNAEGRQLGQAEDDQDEGDDEFDEEGHGGAVQTLVKLVK